MRLFYDLHLHSCLSPCGDGDMTPANLAAMCKLAGLQVVALTDHNTIGNCAPFCKAAQERGLLALPGMELCTQEEIHVVCLFPELAAATAAYGIIREKLPQVKNNVRIFGPQIYMDDGDKILGEELLMLGGVTDVRIDQVAGLCARFGGVAYPAHVDRPSFSLLPCLGQWDLALGFPLAERSARCPSDFWEKNASLSGVSSITGSDAHYLDQVLGAAHTMEVSDWTPGAVLAWLAAGAPGGT